MAAGPRRRQRPVDLRLIEHTRRDLHKGRPGVVLGNGPSRAGYEPPPDAIVVGCNAAYRDTRLDYLVALDQKMIREVVTSGYGGLFVVQVRWLQSVLMELGLEPRPHWLPSSAPSLGYSGYMACYVAALVGCNPITLVGFDGGTGNLYAGTPNYHAHNPQMICEHNAPLRSWQRILELFPGRRWHAAGYMLEKLRELGAVPDRGV